MFPVFFTCLLATTVTKYTVIIVILRQCVHTEILNSNFELLKYMYCYTKYLITTYVQIPF